MTTRKNISNTSRAASLVVTPTIVLKTIHDEIMKANPNATITTKKMRTKLRAAKIAGHVHNASWLFTPEQASGIRAMFDPAYAAKIAKQEKAATRAPRKAKVVKVEEVKEDTNA